MKKVKKLISVVLSLLMVTSAFAGLSISASAAETDNKNTITVSSNLCDSKSYTYDETNDKITVSYYLQSDLLLLDEQTYLTYDSSVLKLEKATADENENLKFLPVFGQYGTVINTNPENKILFNSTSLNLYNFKTKGVYFTATFDIVGSGDTNVNLMVQVLTATKAKNGAELLDSDDVKLVDYFSGRTDQEFYFDSDSELSSIPTPTTEPTTVEPTVAPTTVAPTEAPTTVEPTVAPTTVAPTVAPTTVEPTEAPTTVEPTVAPTTVEPTVAPTTVAPTTPVKDTTMNVVVPTCVSSPKCWNDGIYLGYSNNYLVNSFTKVALTKTTKYLTPDLKTTNLVDGTYALYSVTLTAEQVAAINNSTYVVLMNNAGNYRTYINGKYSILRAPVGTYSDTYNTTKTLMQDLDGYTFVMNGEVQTGTSIQGYGTYTGYWTKCTTIQAVVPGASKWKNCWNQGVYIEYSNDYTLSSFTKIKMTRTSTYIDPNVQTDQLTSGTYPVYTVTLTEDQVAAIDSSTYVIFASASGAYRTYINGKYNVMKANVDEYQETYNTTKSTLAQRANNTFVICGGLSTGTSIEGFGTFTGYWSTKELEIKESTATIYCVFAAPAKNKKAMDNGVYLAYGASNSVNALTKLEMEKTDVKYTPSIKSSALVEGEYNVYKLTLTSDQIEAIDNAKNVVFTSSNGIYRTLLANAYNVLLAKSGTYSATYNKGNFVVEDHDGETFVVCDSKVTGSSTDGYGTFLGYWDLGE